MRQNAIELKKLTKEYAPGVGCFDINLTVKTGEVYGFIGPNGAGKTTVIRQMVSFVKPTSGEAKIFNIEAWGNSQKTMKTLGYLSGEVNLPPYLTGLNYLKTIAAIRQDVDWEYAEKLINFLELDANRKISKMSKGMKQKVAIVKAFMSKPQLLILDEPTSGLDPLMQERFEKILYKAKENGTTVFISSHIFGEIDKLCDRIGFIKKGHLIKEANLDELRLKSPKIYTIQFPKLSEMVRYLKMAPFTILKVSKNKALIELEIEPEKTKSFLNSLQNFEIIKLGEKPFSLENYFKELYENEDFS
ncbi:ABC-2 type transport system ATP-binding protein [Entomoplasma freundtii]|uniref:ABC transporter ATP-binding protein n=1 Tax=Entomoplasma freundtii TaxID=74700 RepID=A0A2K8NQE1_9MOLU|nr:ABC transporter ATP-binding protein [Entomoplasma freundtii]ATZ16039.1 ABC transporter ATP-binding protein [Entomoplasma freundtii]TDY58092.1 ABC-2 type transport system ATP-binding protein [Entomoplasma freundtii]